MPQIQTRILVIPNGETESSAVDIRGFNIAGFHWPAAFTGASFKILPSSDGGATYSASCRNAAGTELTVTKALGDYTYLDLVISAGITHFKIKSASSEAAERTIPCAVRPVS